MNQNRSFITDDEIDRALDFLRDNAREAAQARADRIYVEEYRKTLKAQLMKEHPDMSAVLQEREAYSDPRYVQHLEAIRVAVKADEFSRYMRIAAEAKIEAWRTQSSNVRAVKDMRPVPEWIAKNDNAAIPLRVRLRVYLRTGGNCAKCSRRLAPHRWAVDHVIALVNGGQHRETNLQALCTSPCHSQKSRADVALKSKNYRVSAKAAGLRKAGSSIKSAGFPRAAPQHSATRPLARRADQ